MKLHSLLFAGFVLTGLLFASVSCRKETDCKALVKCVDSTGRAVGNANVLLYAPVKSADGKVTYTADVRAEGQTDGSGEVSFVFKLPAIYDIRATLAVSNRTLVGNGVIKLEEGKTVEKTVSLK